MSADEQAIRKMVADWMAASKAGDIDTVLSLMTDDIVFMTPGNPPFGKKEFAEGFRGMIGKATMAGTSTVEEVAVFGDWGYVRAHIDVTVVPNGGQPMARSGYAMSIVRKQPDGRWAIARDANMLTAKKA